MRRRREVPQEKENIISKPTERSSLPKSSSLFDDSSCWSLKFRLAFSLLCSIRLISSIFNIITDCDETFNYWEPTHYLQHGFGLQTWEYSPEYALRSYLYVYLHVLLEKVFSVHVMHSTNKIASFYMIRGCLGIFCALCESLFYVGVNFHFGNRVGRYTLFFMAVSSGLFHASTAYLPSTFTMYMTMLVYFCWFTKRYFCAILIGVISVIWGWPYVGLMYLPFAMDCIWKRGFVRSILYGIVCSIVVIVPEILMNYNYYQRIVFPALNIIKYNVFGGGGGAGSSLYGTEPWSFYFVNGFLNFNIGFLFSFFAIGVPLMGVIKKMSPTLNEYTFPYVVQDLLFLSPMYMWFLVMMLQPHKEERFLFPIYPLFCLCSAITLRYFVHVLEVFQSLFWRKGMIISKLFVWMILSSSLMISLSRTWSMYQNYHAPLEIYHHFNDHVLDPTTTFKCQTTTSCNLCVGKEWYRFPTSYFLPNDQIHLRFLQSGFKGQLPAPFHPVNGTWHWPSHMNDMNKEEPTRYTSVSQCDYVVDLTLDGQTDHDFLMDQQWEVIYSVPFLNAERSKSFFRAFYIPYVSSNYVSFSPYSLFKRKSV